MCSKIWMVCCRWIAVAGGAGWCPRAPGTAGSLVGLLLCLGVSPQLLSHTWLIVLCVGLSVLTIAPAARSFGSVDPKEIVIDEVVGMLIALWHIPRTWPFLVAGFLLFRLADVYKPLYIRKLERLPNPWGVLLDDVGAGIVVNVMLQIGVWWRV